MGIRRRADLDRRVAVGEAVKPRRSHQHRRHGDGGIDLLVPIVDDAGLHQIGDPVADRPRVDAETLLAAERAGHRLGNRAEAELDRRAVGDQAGDVIGDGAVDRPRRPPGSSIGGRAAGTSTSIAAGSIAVSPWVHGNSGLTCAITNRARPIAACRCSMPSPALYRPVSSGPLTCSSTMSIGRRPLDTRPANIGNIGRHDVVGAAGEKPSPGAGAAQRGDGDVGVAGGEGVAEGQREKRRGMADSAPPGHRASG